MGGMTLRQMRLFPAGALAILLLSSGALAAPREGPQRATPPRVTPSATVPQTEPMDLDEGKSPQQMFSSACVPSAPARSGKGAQRRTARIVSASALHNRFRSGHHTGEFFDVERDGSATGTCNTRIGSGGFGTQAEAG